MADFLKKLRPEKKFNTKFWQAAILGEKKFSFLSIFCLWYVTPKSSSSEIKSSKFKLDSSEEMKLNVFFSLFQCERDDVTDTFL